MAKYVQYHVSPLDKRREREEKKKKKKGTRMREHKIGTKKTIDQLQLGK
jgi:hypothetical protein